MSNRLQFESSPYLIQHAQNPVDWYPWGEDAIHKAHEEDKPIFLSIGYTACHWCHVMAHESFEDPEVAAFLNEHFVSIKVDREERPDLDTIYMQAVIAFTGQGGWPMSVFLTPDLKPFYGGTYFPSKPRYRLPSFLQLIQSINETWLEKRSEVELVTRQVISHLAEMSNATVNTKAAIDPNIINLVVDQLLADYDWKDAGWGIAPKFPAPMSLEFLLLQTARNNPNSFKPVHHNLSMMQRGGMYDVVGGGFHRYSTDANWRIPHFEKMLYDNAQLARVYLHAGILSKDSGFIQTSQDTLNFILREMTDPSGGFYSSLDADSEHEEGKFYSWSKEEIESVLRNDEDFHFFAKVYQLGDRGNYDDKFILQRFASDDDLSEALGISTENFRSILARCHQLLQQSRDHRQRPGTDDKIIVSWNGLALASFAEAARYLNNSKYRSAAQKNAEFLLDNCWKKGGLAHTWKNGKRSSIGFLEDYASLILGLIEIYQMDYDNHWLSSAKTLAEEMIDDYHETGLGFFDTRSDQPNVLMRSRDLQDNALPSGNSMAVTALLKLSHYYEIPKWNDIAEQSILSNQDSFKRYPTAFSFWLQAVDYYLGPVTQIAVTWPSGSGMVEDFQKILQSRWIPRSLIAACSYPTGNIPDLLKDRPPRGETTTAFVCQDFFCRQPTTSPIEFVKLLPEPIF